MPRQGTKKSGPGGAKGETMSLKETLSEDRLKYLELLAEKYPSKGLVQRRIINLNAILNLPKGTEHFMSDIHGEYEAFNHILNNCSGVIREKIRFLFANTLSPYEQNELCTLIYYPEKKLERLKKDGGLSSEQYLHLLKQLIALARYLSSKYTRSKVRKALPDDFAYIIDELMHAQDDEDNNQHVYHEKIFETILNTGSADAFIKALASLIKKLAVDHLHIVGDIYDRGERADEIMDMLMAYPSLDIEWGNHDILWMGAAAGSEPCIANAVRNNIKYRNMPILENGYGITLRSLFLFAQDTYPGLSRQDAAVAAITVITLKLEGQAIKRNPDFCMDDRLLLDKIDRKTGTITIEGKTYALNTTAFPTVDPADPYALSEGEREVMDDLRFSFVNSDRLKKHVDFLYENGSIYRIFNNNLLYHGCIPLDEDGSFSRLTFAGKTYSGRAYMDFADAAARRAINGRDSFSLDFMWYLWGGKKSPLCGRNIKTFERAYIDDETAWNEPKDPYYSFYETGETAGMIIREFNDESPLSHIINGHTPIRVGKGELPIKANGRVIVIDGGFCRAYQKTTGIAGYTLIYNSHGMRLKSHRPFEGIDEVLDRNVDIRSDSETFETEEKRVMVADTDKGRKIAAEISDLKLLLEAYRAGIIKEKNTADAVGTGRA